MVEVCPNNNYLLRDIVVSEGGSTINVSPSTITHFFSNGTTGQHPAPEGYEFALKDRKIYLRSLDGGDDKSCRNSFIDRDGNMPYFFGRGYFYSESDIHQMNMGRKLKAI